MSLIIINDSDEIFECKKSEWVITVILDPMMLSEWYGEEQASHVHREEPLDFIGFIPAPKGRVSTPETTIMLVNTIPWAHQLPVKLQVLRLYCRVGNHSLPTTIAPSRK